MHAERDIQRRRQVAKVTILADGYAERAQTREPLDRRYGEIGISAVAAAVQYQGDLKTSAPECADDRGDADKAA